MNNSTQGKEGQNESVSHHHGLHGDNDFSFIHVLYQDAADPRPAAGWRGRERSSLIERAAPDAVMARAFEHHLALLPGPSPQTHPIARAFAEAEMRADVRSLLLGLTQRQRAALLLVDLLGYPAEQAARILRVRPSTVRNLASQGRRALRATEGARDA